jgi:hypothetical protein
MATYLYFDCSRAGYKGWYRDNRPIKLLPIKAVFLAERIFEFDGETVTWTKNRSGNLTEEINSYELMQIALCSKTLPPPKSIPRKKV